MALVDKRRLIIGGAIGSVALAVSAAGLWAASRDEGSTTRPIAVSTTTSTAPTNSTLLPPIPADPADGDDPIRPPVKPIERWRVLLASDAPRADVYAVISHPANSDVGEEAAALADLGARVAVADVSGQGREEFPGFWPTNDSRGGAPRASDVQVLASGASKRGTGTVEVLVVWQGTDSYGQPTGEETSTVFLREGRNGWQPVHSWEVD